MTNKSEDEVFWEEFTKDIKKIKIAPKISHKKTKEKIQNKPDFSTILPPKAKGYGLDSSTANKFKSESFPIEATLDLHGTTEVNAFSKVTNFIKGSYKKELRCILIITGKGLKKETDDLFEKKGILKDSVPLWLNSDDLKPFILSYRYPSQKLGGTGALLVLLRRNRP